MMTRRPRTSWPEGNSLLDRVGQDDRDAFATSFEEIPLVTGTILYEPGDPLTHVYFPLTGMVSLVAVMHDGRAVETMTIGREGAVATSASGTIDAAFSRFLVQVPGTAIRLAAPAFEDMIAASAELRAAVARYREVLLRTTLQVVACNAIHTVRQRCARWILTTHDRSGTDLLPLTQAALAEMLGVKRNAVSIVIREFARLELIDNRRGQLRVVNRADLNFVSCECYSSIYGELSRLLTDGMDADG